MLYLLDKGDNWSMITRNLKTVVYEDGQREPLTTGHVVVERGKYAGEKLSEIDDVGYLEWMLKVAGENNDEFTQECVSMQLLTLK